MTWTTNEMRTVVDIAAGRALLGACSLALLITTYVPVTRGEGPPGHSLSLWDLAGEGVGSGLAAALPLTLLAVVCAIAVVSEQVVRWAGPLGVFTLLWVGLVVLTGLPGSDSAARWLCVLVPLASVVVAARTDAARRRVVA